MIERIKSTLDVRLSKRYYYCLGLNGGTTVLDFGRHADILIARYYELSRASSSN